MTKTSDTKGFSRCSHPLLVKFTDALLNDIPKDNPLGTARTIAEMARSWPDPAKRRKALAARIALIGLEAQERERVVAEAVEDVTVVETQEVDEAKAPDLAPVVEKSKRKSKQNRLPTPKVSLGDAASLLAAIDTVDNSEFSNPDDFSGGMGMGLSAPLEGGFGRAADLAFGPDDLKGDREMREWSEPEQVTKRWERSLPIEDELTSVAERMETDEKAAPKAGDTATDLSLAILTGEFRRPKAEAEATPQTGTDMPTTPTGDVAELSGDPEPADMPETAPKRALRTSSSRILADGETGTAQPDDHALHEAGIEQAGSEPEATMPVPKKSKKARRIASDMSALSSLMEMGEPNDGAAEVLGGRVVAADEAAGFVTVEPAELTDLGQKQPKESQS